MKYLYLLICVTVVQGFVLENPRVERASHLVFPRITGFTLHDPNEVTLDWTKVTGDDPQDPVLGYKIRVWEHPNIISYKYEIIDGVKTLVQEYIPPKVSNNEIPTSKPREYITDKNTFSVGDLKVNVLYQFGVLAYTKHTNGPMSDLVAIRILPKKMSEKYIYDIA